MTMMLMSIMLRLGLLNFKATKKNNFHFFSFFRATVVYHSLLHSIYCKVQSNFPNILRNNIFAIADTVNIHNEAHVSSLDEVSRALNTNNQFPLEQHRLIATAATNYQKFNDGNTDAVVASSSYSRTKPAPITLMVGDTPIFPAPTVRNLGVTFDSHLNFDAKIRRSSARHSSIR